MDAFLHIFVRIMDSLLVQYNVFWGVIKKCGDCNVSGCAFSIPI